MISFKRLRRLALAGLSITAAPLLAADFTSTWTGGSAVWSSTANWNTPGAPGTFPNNGAFTYDAILSNGGTITLDQNIIIQKFTLNLGSLTGTSSLTTNELLTWSGGAMTGAGVTQASGGMVLSGASAKTLSGGRTLNNAGAAIWTAGQISAGGAAIFNNQAGASFETNFNGTFAFNAGATLPHFNNAGTFTKSGGTGATTISAAFNNTNTVNVNSGTLALTGGGTSSGSFAGLAGTTLELGGGHTLQAGSSVNVSNVLFSSSTNSVSGTFTASGTTTFSGGAITFDGSTAVTLGALVFSGSGSGNFSNSGGASASSLGVSSGTLGGSSTVTISGLTTWSGGTMTGTGVTHANGGMVLSGGTKTLSIGRTLNNAGAATWTAGQISTGGGVIFNNQAGASFETNFDGTFAFNQGGATPQFNNAGTFTKSGGTGTTTISAAFNNTNTVNVNSGTLALTGGGTSSGSFTSLAGTTLELGGGHTLQAASSVNAGSVVFSSSTNSVSGTFTASGTMTFSGGATTFDGSAAITSGALVFSGSGTGNFSNTGGASAGTLGVSSGTLGGSSTVTISGLTTWSGGTMTGTGVTQANGGLVLSGGTKTLSIGRTLSNGGTATWTAGQINTGGGVIFNNQAGANFETNFDGTFAFNQGGGATPQFNNAGTFTKSGGTGTTTISAAFNNTNTVNVNSGTLALTGGGTSSGSFTSLGATTLELGGGHTLQATSSVNAGSVVFSSSTNTVSGTFTASGTTTFSGGATTFDGSTAVTSGALVFLGSGSGNFSNSGGASASSLGISSGALGGSSMVTISGLTTWSGGTMTGTGVTQANGGMLLSGGTKILSGGRTLNNAGAAAWTAGQINTGGAAIFNNQAGASFETNFDGTFAFNQGGAVTQFNNAGTFTKSGGAGTTTISAAFNNTNMVNVNSGTLALTAGGTHTGSFVISTGNTLSFSGGTHTLNAGSAVSGAGTVAISAGMLDFNAGSYAVTGTTAISGGTADFNAAASTNLLTLSVGTLGGPGTLTASGLTTWSSGTMTGAGLTQANGGMVLSGGTKTLTGGRTLNNVGAATWTSGQINTGGGAIFNNQIGASFETNFDGSFLSNQGGAASQFNNVGTFTKNGGTGTTTISATFNNTGAVTVQTGTLTLSGTVTQYSSNTLTGGTWIVLNGATLSIPGPAANIQINNADVTVSGPTSVFARINALTTNNGAFRLLANRSFTATGAFTNTGVLQLGGGTFGAPGLVNSATGEVFGFGTISVRPTNSGRIRSAGGTLVLSNGIQGGSGTVQIDAASTLDLSASTTGSSANLLIHNGTSVGSLNLGAQNFTVDADYTNANFGVGNSFNPRANVTGAGQILASGDVAQNVTGDVTGGTTTTASMTFGNVHVGDVTTRNYRIANAGASGPSLRGAIQTSVNGGNITDARLSGSGITASNFGPIVPGANSGDQTVTFTASSAGALTGQVIHLVNNFDNVAEQNIQIVNSAAFRFANPSAHTPEPVSFGNFHVGDAAPSQAISVTNNVPDDGCSEALNATLGSATGGVTASGSFSLVAPGATNNASLLVGISTATAGNKNGTATITLQSNGTGSSGLALTNLASQTVNVTGAIFRLASASAHMPEPAVFGYFHVGDSVMSQALSITNTAVNDGFSEALNASIIGASSGVTASGSFSLLAPGATNNTSLLVGIDTASPGLKNGTVTVSFQSDGTGSSGLGLTNLASQIVNVTGAVFRLASASAHTPEPVNFGNRHVGDVLQQALSITNTAANDGFSEELDAEFGASVGNATSSGSFGQLAAQATNNTNLIVGIDTSTAGAKSGSVLLNLCSNTSGTSDLARTALPSQTVNVSANVYRLASARAHTPEPVNFGTFHVGALAPSQTLSVTNNVPNDGFSEALDGTIGSPTGGVTTNAGSFSLLAPGATNSASLTVGIDTSSAGSKDGTATISLTSNGSGSSALGTTPLASQTVNVTGFVYSGLGIWNIDSSGTWNATANWQMPGGVPGLDGGFTNTDTATFSSAATSANPTVSLDGVSPSLKDLTFDNSTQSYTLAQGAGDGLLKLDNGVGTASLTDSNGDHTISAPIELHSDLAVTVSASDTLAVCSGIIETGGAKRLTKSGDGTLILAGTLSFSTLTTSGGTTDFEVPLGTGASTVNANAATNFGTNQTLAALNIGTGGVVTISAGLPASADEFDGSSIFADAGGGKGGTLTGESAQVVPEPGIFSLLGVGSLLLNLRRKRPATP